ncbi:MAG: protein-glutamate O-methyltransferase CheR [Planctomycetota bacterium]
MAYHSASGLTPAAFQLLADFIRQECGIEVPDEKQYLIDVRLAHLVREEQCASYMELYNRARADGSGRLKDRIIDAITTNETHWFRDHRAWAALRTVVLPGFLEAAGRDSVRRIRIWSAGCSTGQEPYSLAMLISDLAGDRRGQAGAGFRILATDISREALGIARGGRYNRISMARGLELSFRARFFRPVGSLWELLPAIREAVEFRAQNLLAPLTGEEPFDMVLCRNVAIYFSDPFRARLFRNLTAMLRPGGYLFLGSSESLLPFLAGYESIDNGIYFRRKP